MKAKTLCYCIAVVLFTGFTITFFLGKAITEPSKHPINITHRTSNKEKPSVKPIAYNEAALVRKDTKSAKYCPHQKYGEICLMRWKDAVKYCQEQGGRMPTAREMALFVQAPKDILQPDQVPDGKTPEGYLDVSCAEQDGSIDDFYVDNDKGHSVSAASFPVSFWASSRVFDKSHKLILPYAHVLYVFKKDDGKFWARGGGDPGDHLITARHAVYLIKP